MFRFFQTAHKASTQHFKNVQTNSKTNLTTGLNSLFTKMFYPASFYTGNFYNQTTSYNDVNPSFNTQKYKIQRKHQQLNKSSNLDNFLKFQTSKWNNQVARNFSNSEPAAKETNSAGLGVEELAKIDKDILTEGEPFVKEGKEKVVGSWLLLFSFSVALMIAVGGYTRLSKSGLSMVRWKPINYKLPNTLEEWNVEFDAYKVSLKLLEFC